MTFIAEFEDCADFISKYSGISINRFNREIERMDNLTSNE